MSSAVQRILERGRAEFPAVAAGAGALEALIRDRLRGEEAPDQLDASEIYLACACALADPHAIAMFERRYFGVIPAALSRLALSRDDIAEIEQQLRVRLFVTEADGVPRVVTYAGAGQLAGLVRVAALRIGLNRLRDRGRIAEVGDGLDEIPLAVDDPALAQLKVQHRVAFKAAFEEAIRELDPRERAVLDLALVKGLGIDQIGAIYGVHRATAARWIAAARDHLGRAVHRVLGAKLGIHASQLGELVPLVESQLELSLERLLRSRGPV
jgi:RNA polymerase sigma-70 factor (ECF subfamily)